MLASSLPPPTAVSVSAGARLAYVLHHFGLAYPGGPAVSVGYAGSRPQVEVADLGEAFFEQAIPYPPAPAWREWQGQRVPFFFAGSSEKPLLSLQEGKAVISADVIAGAFYLLSGWQEYFSPERDQHGRFPYAASVQQRYGFVALPVVNYYFDVLRAAVAHVSDRALHPRRWESQQAAFAAFVSHDVDNLHSAWKAPAKAALRQLSPALFGKLLWRHLTQPDAWDNLEAVAAATARHGAKSTFFILGRQQPAANGTPNADYASTAAPLRARLARLAQQGAEIACHGSYGTATAAPHLLAELRQLAPPAPGNRFHYLGWEPTRTPGVLAQAGVPYDATLGFAEHFGFRNSYCQPFFPFDFERGQAHGFLEIPLVVMDATLHHPSYLHLPAAEILPALQPVFAEIKKFGGVASVLWHNQNFDPSNHQTGPQQFHELLNYLGQQGAAFLTGREIWQAFHL